VVVAFELHALRPIVQIRARPLVRVAVIALVGYGLLLPGSGAWAQTSWQSVVQWLYSSQNQSSAWAVTTKQTSVSANQEADSTHASQQQLATAMGAISMSNRVTDEVLSVDGVLGQPVANKCVAVKNAEMQVQAWQQVDMDRSKLIATFASTRVSTAAQGQLERIALHRNSYCSVSEARMGMCQLRADGMQGWDVNYGGAFGEHTLAAEGELAGYAYAAMVADARAPAAIDCKSSACSAAAVQQLANAAAGTMVADAFLGQVLERRVPMITGQ
jgi:hypothetical protein